MTINSNKKIKNITKLLILIIIFVSTEDFIRRIFRDIPASILVLKTIFLTLVYFYYKIRLTPFNFRIFVTITVILLIVIGLLNITSTINLLRAAIWWNAVIILPILVTAIMLKIGDDNSIKIFKGIFIVTILSGIFAAYSYFSGTFSDLDAIGGPIIGGYRFFEGQRLYFNAGWFFSAERLSWFCAIGITTCFILIINERKKKKQLIYFIFIFFILFISFTTGRVTGFLLTLFIFFGSILILSTKNKKWLPYLIIISLLLVFFYQDIITALGQDTRMSFMIEHSSTIDERGSFYYGNIANVMQYAGPLGLGPMPQGLQYLDNQTYLSFQHIQSEGLISFSILQFGVFSFIHLAFNLLFILLALRAIIKYNDYKFLLGILLLALKIWIIKASQMETDTFAQFFLYIMITPLIKDYFKEKLDSRLKRNKKYVKNA